MALEVCLRVPAVMIVLNEIQYNGQVLFDMRGNVLCVSCVDQRDRFR